MKKMIILTALAVLLGVATATAQQIAVVSEGGETSVFTTLQAAIEGAAPSSVIYLPGGSFPLPDNVKITKKLTIIGIGHKPNNDNVDGVTIISGNLFFNEGSSGSAVMGCYLSGIVLIGDGGSIVNNTVVKCCNIGDFQILNNQCLGTYINQNYIRGRNSHCSDGEVVLKNNIMKGIKHINGGTIQNNIFTHWADAYTGSLNYIYNSIVTNNVITCIWTGNGSSFRFGDNIFSNNIQLEPFGENVILLEEGKTWEDLFVNWNWNENDAAVNSLSDFHFKDEYKQYENQIGIYGGSGFNDHQTAPVPYIMAKRIAEETDEAGQLRIQVRVKAGD